MGHTQCREGEGGNLACWGLGVEDVEDCWEKQLACCKTTPKPSCIQIHTFLTLAGGHLRMSQSSTSTRLIPASAWGGSASKD